MTHYTPAPVTRESRHMSRVTGCVTFAVSHSTPSRPGPARPSQKQVVTSNSNVQSVPRESRNFGVGGDAT